MVLSLQDCLFAFLIEQIKLIGIDRELEIIARLNPRA